MARWLHPMQKNNQVLVQSLSCLTVTLPQLIAKRYQKRLDRTQQPGGFDFMATKSHLIMSDLGFRV